MPRKWFAGAVLIGLLTLSAIGPFDWATAEASPLGQFTVPTFTPTPGTVTPEPLPTGRTPEPATPVPSTAISGTSAAPALLPVAGGDTTDRPLLLIALGSGLLIMVSALRRRA